MQFDNHKNTTSEEPYELALQWNASDKPVRAFSDGTLREIAYAYVCAWSVERVFGGPEEGGWWYEAGQPIAAIPVQDYDAHLLAKEFLHKMFPRTWGRSDDVRITTQAQWPEEYPKHRPTYQ